jgi:hypothetical protein
MSISKDYLRNLPDARELARSIALYWKDRGYFGVRTWVEKDDSFGKPYFYVRSNIRYTVPKGE